MISQSIKNSLKIYIHLILNFSFARFLYSFNKYHNAIESFHPETHNNIVSHSFIISKSLIAVLIFFSIFFSSAPTLL